MTTFKGWLISKMDDTSRVEFTDILASELIHGDVTIDIEHSSINYKDALAFTGSAPVVRKWPMIPGVDLAGRVRHSSSPQFEKGDDVFVNGWGIGETHWGGLAEQCKMHAKWVMKRPEAFSSHDVMAIGTAGYTAMLCVLALENNGITPGDGYILVTGASGGVGTIAVSILSRLGYKVCASTGKAEDADFFKSLGAHEVMHRDILLTGGKVLGKEMWAGVIDTIGGKSLVNALSQTSYKGTVAACGMAQDMALPTATVMPFIIRGVSLIGIDSVMCPMAQRQEAWRRLAQDLDTEMLSKITTSLPLVDAKKAAENLMEGTHRGRIIINI